MPYCQPVPTKGAWVYKVDIKPTEEDPAGILNGGPVLKDNVALQEFLCLVGTEGFSEWLPETDTTVVCLKAGGNIKGKAVC